MSFLSVSPSKFIVFYAVRSVSRKLSVSVELVPKIPRCTACFTCSPPNGNITKFRPNAAHQTLLKLKFN
jgi:hypothetical protein